MKVIFLCRDCYESYYIANKLFEENILDGIIIESGINAKKHKLYKTFKNKKYWLYPLIIVDLIVLTTYRFCCNYSIRKFVGYELKTNGFPIDVKKINVEDVNESETINFLKEHETDTLVVHGTSILRNVIIDIPKKHILNIHGGIVPKYRNVHSEFWAYLNKDYQNIGTSIIYLDEGIDSGDIAKQGCIVVNKRDSIFEIHKKNLVLAGNMIVSVLHNVEKSPTRTIQNDNYSLYTTPRASDFFKLVMISIKNKLSY